MGYRSRCRAGAVVLCAVLALFASACGDSATSKAAQVIKTSHALNGKRVDAVGYFKTTKVTFVTNGVAPLVLVPSTMSDAGSATLENIMVKFGKEPNTIFMPERYKGNDIEIRDASGRVNDINTKFKVTGTVVYDSTEKIAPPKPPSGAFVMDSQKRNYAAAKAKYEERVKKNDLYDYSYRIVDVVIARQ